MVVLAGWEQQGRTNYALLILMNHSDGILRDRSGDFEFDDVNTDGRELASYCPTFPFRLYL
jgi:hypothetical protein